jgi:DNA-binding Lrp family transcriptional regulator
MRPLDRTDHALVALLQNNARTSTKELAAAVGVAPSTALERVRRLEADGVITGYHADLDLGALGLGL